MTPADEARRAAINRMTTPWVLLIATAGATKSNKTMMTMDGDGVEWLCCLEMRMEMEALQWQHSRALMVAW